MFSAGPKCLKIMKNFPLTFHSFNSQTLLGRSNSADLCLNKNEMLCEIDDVLFWCFRTVNMS